MDDVRLRLLASEMGLVDAYDRKEGFKETFETICAAVENLPPHLIAQGRSLPYPQLHWAVRNGDLPMIVGLLDAGADPDGYTNLEDDEDETPLVWLADTPAIKHPLKKKITLEFIKKDAYLNDALNKAVDNDDDKFADFLREHGAED